MSVGWITVILVLIALLNVASNITYLAAVTRDLFAFARDRGELSVVLKVRRP
jgi:choline transport protein